MDRARGRVFPNTPILQSKAAGFEAYYGLDHDDLEMVVMSRDGGYERNPYVANENQANGGDENPHDIPCIEDVSDYLWKSYDDGQRQSPGRYRGRCCSFMAYRVRLDRFERLFPR